MNHRQIRYWFRSQHTPLRMVRSTNTLYISNGCLSTFETLLDTSVCHYNKVIHLFSLPRYSVLIRVTLSGLSLNILLFWSTQCLLVTCCCQNYKRLLLPDSTKVYHFIKNGAPGRIRTGVNKFCRLVHKPL